MPAGSILGLAVEVEEIVNILVSNDQIDEILERIYKAGKLDTPGMGIAYVLPVEKAATHVSRDLLEARAWSCLPGKR